MIKEKQHKHMYSYFPFLLAETPRNLNQVTINYQYQSSLCRVLKFCGTTFVETAVYYLMLHVILQKQHICHNHSRSLSTKLEPKQHLEPKSISIIVTTHSTTRHEFSQCSCLFIVHVTCHGMYNISHQVSQKIQMLL